MRSNSSIQTSPSWLFYSFTSKGDPHKREGEEALCNSRMMNCIGNNIWSLVSLSTAAEKGWYTRKTKDEKRYKWRGGSWHYSAPSQWWLRKEIPKGGGWLCFSVMCSVFNPYAREINIWEPQQWAAVWWSSGSPGRKVLVMGAHRLGEWWQARTLWYRRVMHSDLVMMMTGDSFEVSWRRWNSFTFISAVTGIQEESWKKRCLRWWLSPLHRC